MNPKRSIISGPFTQYAKGFSRTMFVIQFSGKILALLQVLSAILDISASFYPHTVKNRAAVNEELLIRRVTAQDWMSCIVSCQNDPNCISYNYGYTKEIHGFCELFKCGVNQKRDSKDELIYSYGYMFQQLKRGEKMNHCRTGCREGWTRFKLHCYKAMNAARTWDTASRLCKIEGGNLVSIQSEEENNFLISIAMRLGLSSFWIGLKVTEHNSSEFKYSDGTNTFFKKFAAYGSGGACHCEDDLENKCHCVKLSSNRNQWHWCYSTCTERNEFVCKL